MDVEKLIARINVLAKKKKEQGLTEAELTEQKQLYKEYLALIKGNLKAQLDNIEVVDKK